MRISGLGVLRIDGADVCRAEYDISIMGSSDGMKTASGILSANHIDIARTFEAAHGVTLVRDDCGHEMKILIEHHQMGSDQAQIKLGGSPGPSQ